MAVVLMRRGDSTQASSENCVCGWVGFTVYRGQDPKHGTLQKLKTQNLTGPHPSSLKPKSPKALNLKHPKIEKSLAAGSGLRLHPTFSLTSSSTSAMLRKYITKSYQGTL